MSLGITGIDQRFHPLPSLAAIQARLAILTLRRKIEQDPTNPIYLQTARGAGYRLVADR